MHFDARTILKVATYGRARRAAGETRPMNMNPITDYKSLWGATQHLAPVTHEGSGYIKQPGTMAEGLDYLLHGAPVTDAPVGQTPSGPGTYAKVTPGPATMLPNPLVRVPKGGRIYTGDEGLAKLLHKQIAPAEQMYNQLPPVAREAAEKLAPMGEKLHPALKGLQLPAALNALEAGGPQVQDSLNKLVQLHEGTERKIGKRTGVTGPRFFSHVDPDVIFTESNLARTAAKSPTLRPAADVMAAARAPMEADAIKQKYPWFEYGKTRLSPRMRKGMSAGLLNRPTAELGNTEQGVRTQVKARAAVEQGVNKGRELFGRLSTAAAPYLPKGHNLESFAKQWLGKLKL